MKTPWGVHISIDTQKSHNTCTGTVDGLTLRARGVLLEHRAAAVAVEEARAIARLRVRVPAVRDWVIDFSAPGALWIVSDGAWYRCASPHTCLIRSFSVGSATLQ